MKPVRIQRSRQHKQISPNGLEIKYVGRPTKWGNPFKITGQKGHWFVMGIDNNPFVAFENKLQALQCCIECYKDYISHEHNSGKVNVFELRGKNLSCWCKIGEPCHVDVLLELVSEK